jgi:hypothetical protein
MVQPIFCLKRKRNRYAGQLTLPVCLVSFRGHGAISECLVCTVADDETMKICNVVQAVMKFLANKG